MSLSPILGPHRLVPIAGGDICRAYRVEADGGTYFAKTPLRADAYLLPTEAKGLAGIGAVVPGLVPAVVHADAEWLVLEWVAAGSASTAAAESLGRRLAHLHSAAADAFGTGPEHGRIGSLPMPAAQFGSWPEMYATIRLGPLLGPDLPQTTALAEALLAQPEWAGPPEPPSLLHGDLWSGNVIWAEEPVLVDPASHTGHRETDLAMLALFGAPHLDRVLAAYDEAAPLADGWQERVGLHQLWPLLVHARLFGGGYGGQAERISTGYLRGR